MQDSERSSFAMALVAGGVLALHTGHADIDPAMPAMAEIVIADARSI